MKKYIIVVFSFFIIVSCSYPQEEVENNLQEKQNNASMKSGSIDNSMSFFVTSVNPWNWADFWGLVGADVYCNSLAQNAWIDSKNWHAYLSSSPTDDSLSINARDRIWNGPWYNAVWELIALNIEELHNKNNINKQTALDENGNTIMWRWDDVNKHDILTWSTPEWTYSWSTTDDTTCSNWTSNNEWSAFLWHHDRMWLDESDSAKSWNSSHLSRWCSLDNLKKTGWNWLIYCFWEKK